ncbi:ABC transporter ATP-binding protein [Sphingomonas sp. LaA6.9]|uniref:ABC transporter ATP-binding protein n=1 Tax=Sphingomonas sp. LaA6.9 TaxID=2919914 RepID=UPI001F50238A|nr:ABC transporter ATP-binding protein [Sphingomonas sp. LaA6.9]MCJ8159657.1 ABC transporter ATP-binding protein [Sphingomonas sp. LaA6.9]
MVTLSISALHVSLGKRAVLQGIDAELEGGSLIGIIGPNGAGKSTLARAILHLIEPISGMIALDGANVTTMSRDAIARRIAYLPQGQTLHWPLTVERLVGLGRLPHLAPFSRLMPADTQAIERAMQCADVMALRRRNALELSGGERARVLLARALAVEADVLIADEPLAALDPGHQLQVMELLAAQAHAGALVIAVLHDLTMAARYCDRLLLIDEGRLAADGDADAVLTEALLERVYGVRAWTGVADGHRLIVPMSLTA